MRSGPPVRVVAYAVVLVACASGTGGASVPRRTVAEAICRVGSVGDACRVFFQGHCDRPSLMRRSPRGGFTEGSCDEGRFISEPAHPEGEFRDYFFDGNDALIGMRWCGDMNMACPSTSGTGTHVCEAWGDIPRCELVTEDVHEPEEP